MRNVKRAALSLGIGIAALAALFATPSASADHYYYRGGYSYCSTPRVRVVYQPICRPVYRTYRTIRHRPVTYHRSTRYYRPSRYVRRYGYRY